MNFADTRSDKCTAYQCKLYKDIGSDKYCTLHLIEISALLSSSDDFKSKIPVIHQMKMRCVNHDETCTPGENNLIEDYIMFNSDIIRGCWCLLHYSKLTRNIYGNLTYRCEYIGCCETTNLVKGVKVLCQYHAHSTSWCSHPKCNKTSNLVYKDGKYVCVKHSQSGNNSKKPFWKIASKVAEAKEYLSKAHLTKDEITVKISENTDNSACSNSQNDASHIKIPEISNKNAQNKLWIDVATSTTVMEPKSMYTILKKQSVVKTCNANGKELCHAQDCKIYKCLYEKYQGKWCANHYEEMKQIRSIIKKHDGSKKELMARIEEFRLRKFFDLGHWKWIIKLMKDHA